MDKTMSNNQELEKQIREAVKKYRESGGGDFYIISQKDHDRNWLEAKRQVGLALINKIEELIDSRFEGCSGYYPSVDENGKDKYGCKYCGEAKYSNVHTISELKKGINKLKQEIE